MVEDSIQDIFVLMCEQPHLIAGAKNLDSYLRVSLKREILKKLENSRKRSVTGEVFDISIPSYEDALVKKQDSIQLSIKLRHVLELLTPSQRTVLTLRFYRGLSYEEIADKMGITKRTVYNQVHDAMKKLKKEI